MNDSDLKIVKFTNIAGFDFTPEMGAMFDGRPFFVKAGESKLYPLTIGGHLAEHLARQIILKEDKAGKDDTNGQGRPMWNEESIKKVKAKILSEVYEEEKPKAVSETDKLMSKVEDLNKNEGTTASATEYKDKAEVLAALRAKGVNPDARQSKAKLEAQLKELE